MQGTHVCKSMDGTEFLNPEQSPGGIPSQDITLHNSTIGFGGFSVLVLGFGRSLHQSRFDNRTPNLKDNNCTGEVLAVQK